MTSIRLHIGEGIREEKRGWRERERERGEMKKGVVGNVRGTTGNLRSSRPISGKRDMRTLG